MDIDINESINEEIKVNLYHIIQELFSNIVKHSGADSVQVFFHMADINNISLVVEDNGIGFEYQSCAGKGFGLSTIRQRCENIGCSLTIESVIGHGTKIIIEKKIQT